MPVFTHLLVPLDGSRLAEATLPVAFGLAEGLGARVTLLHVLERAAPKTVHGEPHLGDAQVAERYLQSLADRYTKLGVPVDLHVHANEENDVAGSIVAHAQEMAVDLIALSPHGRGDIRRWLIGSIPQLVLQKGSTPVLLVPSISDEAPDFKLRKLLVPLDGHEAENVLRVARELCATFGAQACLVQVVPTLSTIRGDKAATAILTPSATAATLDLAENAAQEYLAEVTAAWPEQTRPGTQVLRGEPAQAILDQIQQGKPDLTLMSTHGRSGLPGLWSASVAAKVVARSDRPMLLMRVAD